MAKLNPPKKLEKAPVDDDKIPMEHAPKAEATKPKEIKPAFGDDGLPMAATSQVVSMLTLGWLFVGPPGFGKSELFSCFPDSLMLATEAGHKFITCPKLIIDDWTIPGSQNNPADDDGNKHMGFIQALEMLESSERFPFVFIDTLDALIKKCIDHHVSKANQAHLTDLGDYGKGFDLGQNDPIRKAINRIFSTGRGLGLITHQQINQNNFGKGVKAKKETSLPNGIHKIIYPQMDIVIHGEFGEIQEGNNFKDRIIRSQGDESILAKNRGGILPAAFISPEPLEERGAQIQSFFQADPIKRKAAVEAAWAQYQSVYQDE